MRVNNFNALINKNTNDKLHRRLIKNTYQLREFHLNLARRPRTRIRNWPLDGAGGRDFDCVGGPIEKTKWRHHFSVHIRDAVVFNFMLCHNE